MLSSYKKFKKEFLKKSDVFRKELNNDYRSKAIVSYNYSLFGYKTDWKELLENIKNSEELKDNYWNEYICDNQLVRPYLDIEWLDHNYASEKILDKRYYKNIILKDIVESTIKLFKEEWEIDLHRDCIKIKECHRDVPEGYKISYHLIISTEVCSVVFTNNVECVYFAKKLKQYTKYPEVVDLSVYSKFRNLRLLGHSKITSQKHKFKVFIDDRDEELNELDYLVTFVHRKYQILATREELVTNYHDIKKGKEVTEEIISFIIDKLKQFHPTVYFDHVDQNNFIQFNYVDRQEKCFFTGNRLHDKIGFFAKIENEGNKDGNIRIGCYSAHCTDEKGHKTIYLGNIYEKFKEVENNNAVTYNEKVYLDPFITREHVSHKAIGLSQIFEDIYLKPVKRIKWTDSEKTTGTVYFWDGKIWCEDNHSFLNKILSTQIPKILKNTISNILNADKILKTKTNVVQDDLVSIDSLNTIDDDQQKFLKECYKLIDSLEMGTINNNVLKFIRPSANDIHFPKIKNIHPNRLAAFNGMVNLKDKTLKYSVPEDNITRHLELEYKPEIYGRNGENSKFYNEWNQFVIDITREKTGEVNEEIFNFMRWIFGYSIQGIPKHKKFFIFWGPEGYNGKSILLNTLSDVLEDYCVTMDKSIVLESKQKTSGSHSTELVRLENCRIGILSDTKENCCIEDGQIKQLTSITDKISVREIYGKQKEIKPTFVPIIATNYKIRVNLADPSMYERLILFPFHIRFLDKPVEAHHRKSDPNLAEKFTNPEYKKSILCWIIDCAEYYCLNTNLPVPKKLLEVKNQYRKEMNIYLEFKDSYFECDPEDMEVINKKKNWYRKADVIEMYMEYCQDNGIKYIPGKIQKELDVYFLSSKIDNINCYIGIKKKIN